MAFSIAETTQPDEIRRSTKASPDPRAARTRAAILAAVETLATRDDGEITVKDIVRVAGVSRGAFYTHFAGIDELAVGIVRDAFDAIGTSDLELRRGERVAGDTASRIALTRLLEHVVEHRALYTTVLTLPTSSRAYVAAIDAFAVHVRNTIGLLAPASEHVRAEHVARYIAGGTFAYLASWLGSARPIAASEAVDQLMAVLPPWLVDPRPSA